MTNEESKSVWDNPLNFNLKNPRPKSVKKSHTPSKVGLTARVTESMNPTIEEQKKLQSMTLEEKYKELKKKRKIKHIDVSEDIDVKFKELPKRLRLVNHCYYCYSDHF